MLFVALWKKKYLSNNSLWPERMHSILIESIVFAGKNMIRMQKEVAICNKLIRCKCIAMHSSR